MITIQTLKTAVQNARMLDAEIATFGILMVEPKNVMMLTWSLQIAVLHARMLHAEMGLYGLLEVAKFVMMAILT